MVTKFIKTIIIILLVLLVAAIYSGVASAWTLLVNDTYNRPNSNSLGTSSDGNIFYIEGGGSDLIGIVSNSNRRVNSPTTDECALYNRLDSVKYFNVSLGLNVTFKSVGLDDAYLWNMKFDEVNQSCTTRDTIGAGGNGIQLDMQMYAGTCEFLNYTDTTKSSTIANCGGTLTEGNYEITFYVNLTNFVFYANGSKIINEDISAKVDFSNGVYIYQGGGGDAGSPAWSLDDLYINEKQLDSSPSFSNNATNASSTRINGNVTFNITISDLSGNNRGLKNFSFSWNGTGVWENTTNGSISGTSVNLFINKSTNLSQGNTIGYIWYSTDISNQTSNSIMRTFKVLNSEPTISLLILNNTSPLTSDDINITCLGADADNDALTYNYLWYVNGTDFGYKNVALYSPNVTLGANITGQCNVTDTQGVSVIQNSSTMTVGDSTKPVLDSFEISPSSGDTGTVITINVNCSDGNSLASNYPYVSIFHSVAGLKDNKSMTLQTGDKYQTTYTTQESSGTYNFTFYCKDGSDNHITNSTSGLLFSASSDTSPISGGGGGTTVTQCATDEDCKVFGDKYICIKKYCIFSESEPVCNYNGICEPERGENFLNCGDQLLEDGVTVLEGDCDAFSLRDITALALSSQFFLWIVFGLFVALLIYLNIQSPDSKIKKYYKRTFKRKRPTFFG